MEYFKKVCLLVYTKIKEFIIEIFTELIKPFEHFTLKEDYVKTKRDINKLLKRIKLYFDNFKISNYTSKQKLRFTAFIVFLSVCSINDYNALSQNIIPKTCNTIYVDGEKILSVPASINVDIDEVLNSYLTKKEGREARVTSDIEVKKDKVYGYELTKPLDAVTKLMDSVDYDLYAADLILDEDHILYADSIPELSRILDDFKKPYEDPKYSEVTFKEDVEMEEHFVPSDEILTEDEIVETLKGNKSEEQTHEVVEGDTLWDISIENEVTVDDLIYANPELTEDSVLQLGDEIVIKNSVPMLTVRAYQRVVYDDVAAYDTQTIENDEEYINYREVVTPGVNGMKTVTADIVYDNGVETDRLIIDEEITKEPVNEVIEVGTMNKPPKKAIGSFIFPAPGRISDTFGARGGEHEGIDIANSAGTPVVASDGGRVAYAGWSSGGYGNLVVIDHQNGYSTYYGHNSSVEVTEGQMVAQGEEIAKMGSTGRSTGNHCHFEVRVNGVPKNPFNYLSY